MIAPSAGILPGLPIWEALSCPLAPITPRREATRPQFQPPRTPLPRIQIFSQNRLFFFPAGPFRTDRSHLPPLDSRNEPPCHQIKLQVKAFKHGLHHVHGVKRYDIVLVVFCNCRILGLTAPESRRVPHDKTRAPPGHAHTREDPFGPISAARVTFLLRRTEHG